MAHMNPAEIGTVMIFKQLVPSPFGRYENDIEINSLHVHSVRFKCKLRSAAWATDVEWNEIDVAFSYAGREQTALKPWRRERYRKIGQVSWIS